MRKKMLTIIHSLRSTSMLLATRLSVSVCQSRVVWIRRPSYALWYLVSASGHLASRHSASHFQNRVICRPEPFLGSIRNSESASQRQASQRSSVSDAVSDGILRASCAKCVVFCRCRDVWRRDARRWFTRILSYGVPSLVLS